MTFDGINLDYPIFSQCEFIDTICFIASIRENRIVLSFDANNTYGKILIGSNAVADGV